MSRQTWVGVILEVKLGVSEELLQARRAAPWAQACGQERSGKGSEGGLGVHVLLLGWCACGASRLRPVYSARDASNSPCPALG